MSILLYHGSTSIVEQPLVSTGRLNLDFGQAFYLTRLHTQAEGWAKRMMLLRSVDQAYINIYEFDLDTVLQEGFHMLSFEAYNRSWLDFIAESRRGGKPWMNYDIIEGGVANDRIFDTIEAYLDGKYTVEQALEQLVYTKPNNQMALLNQRMIDQHLCYVSSELVVNVLTEGGGSL